MTRLRVSEAIGGYRILYDQEEGLSIFLIGSDELAIYFTTEELPELFELIHLMHTLHIKRPLT